MDHALMELLAFWRVLPTLFLAFRIRSRSFATLSERVKKLSLEEAKWRISSTEDSATAMERQVTNLKTMLDQLQIKIDEELTEWRELRFYSDLSAGLLQKHCEFGSMGKAFATRSLYHGFAHPARLRCLNNGKICLFSDPDSAKAFLEYLDS